MTDAPNAFAMAAQQAQTQTAPPQQYQQQAQTVPAQAVPAGYVQDTAGNLTESFAGKPSQLFSGPTLPPSLLNKTHTLGTERSGVITVAPYDVQSRDFKTKRPKFWANSPMPDGSKISTNPLDHITGEKLRPVMDTVVELATNYRFDAAECAAIERDPTMPDDGARAFYISGNDLKQLKSEIARLGGIRDEAGMIGLTLTVQRVAQKPNPGGYPSWINKITLSR